MNCVNDDLALATLAYVGVVRMHLGAACRIDEAPLLTEEELLCNLFNGGNTAGSGGAYGKLAGLVKIELDNALGTVTV